MWLACCSRVESRSGCPKIKPFVALGQQYLVVAPSPLGLGVGPSLNGVKAQDFYGRGVDGEAAL